MSTLSFRRLVIPFRCPIFCSPAFWNGLLRMLKPYLPNCSVFNTSLQIIMYSDLESDYINPIDFCNKLNQVGFYNLPNNGFILNIPPVCPTRIRRTWFSGPSLPPTWGVVCIVVEFTSCCLECEQVSLSEVLFSFPRR